MSNLSPAALKALAAAGIDMDVVERAQATIAREQQATARKAAASAAAVYVTEDLVRAVVAGGITKSAKSDWQGATIQGVPVEVDGQKYTVKVVVTVKA